HPGTLRRRPQHRGPVSRGPRLCERALDRRGHLFRARGGPQRGCDGAVEPPMKLFEPIRIGSMTVKNRIVMSPMTTGYAGLDQLPTPRLVDYLAARARGGVGLVTLEACVVDRRHREVPQSMHFSSDDVIDAHRPITDAI